MAELKQLDKTFNFIMRYMVETGRAPFYSEIAGELGVSMEEGGKVLRDLMGSGQPAWLFPNTDYISSFPPFSSLPTQYRISIEGEQKWYGQ